MSKVKTVVELEEIEKFLKNNRSPTIKNIQILKGGEISQAFSFEDENKKFILKVRKVRKIHARREPFQKELNAREYIFQRDNNIPIPKVLQLGTYSEKEENRHIYCIVEKMEGSFVHLLPPKKHSIVDTALIQILQRIHCIDISKTSNYGHWESFDLATSNSWKEFILSQINKHKIFKKESIKQGEYNIDFLQEAIKKVTKLLKFCSEKRYLVHADYGYDNVLANSEGCITAVFDWEHSLFGDFAYDIAWLDFWKFREERTYEKLYKDVDQNLCPLDFSYYDERIRCYKMYIGIMAVSYFIDSDQRESFLSTKKIVESLF